MVLGLRVFAGAMVGGALVFLLNAYLSFWREWPGPLAMMAEQQWFGLAPLAQPLETGSLSLGGVQIASYPTMLVLVIAYVLLTARRSLRIDAERLSAFAAYIVRSSFWAVFLIGLADSLISFLRVEDLLEPLVGQHLTTELGRSVYRGTYVHYPLVAIAFVIGLMVRSLGFTWLALLVVIAEFQIVISRFVFSYEQAFMGDLVRFWYAALFLFASAFALINEGHVRVDVLYARFSQRGKAWTNLLGSLLLGLPLCWVILTLGMWSKGASISSPLLSFEISQSGFGMYVKYLMAGFLIVFATSMIVQFSSYVLSGAADLRGEPDPQEPDAENPEVIPDEAAMTVTGAGTD